MTESPHETPGTGAIDHEIDRRGIVKTGVWLVAITLGSFVVAWQQFKNNDWSEPTKFDGKRKGRTWYTVRTAGGLKVRILAIRSGAGKKAPIWVSPTFKTRTTTPG